MRHLQAIQAKGLIPHELAACAGDVVYWLQNWGWTYDPRRDEAKFLPIEPWPQQIEFLRWLEGREKAKKGGLVEKSRDWGLSYLCCYFAVHRWLFSAGYSVGFGSRKEMYVDRAGDPDSIFEKLRIIIDALPPWMKPKGYDRNQHAPFCKIINPENGSTITGEAGDNIGRGGRKSIYFVDEAAFIERASLIDRSLVGTTECRIDVSTPNGIGNPFYTKRHSGNVPVFVADWRDDPRKNDEWAEEKKREVGPVVFAQEYDRDYSASIEGICIPAAWVKASIGLKLNYKPAGPQIGGQDIAEEGTDDSVLITGQGPLVNDVVAWGQVTTTQTAYRVVQECRSKVIRRVKYDADGVGTGPKGIWKAMSDNDKRLWMPEGPVIEFDGINTGTQPTDAVWPDGRTSKEIFGNLKAEAWWTLRCRFERTFEHVTQGIEHPHEELISIPDDPKFHTLIAQLSVPKVEYNDKGKIVIESKKKLKARGIKSPDHAEALVLLFCPEGRKWEFWVV